ncbi:MAG: hypothetical protein H7257_04860 [Taibaiella sp.]|nr:hypothetical protein [Taibaiella sp.]
MYTRTYSIMSSFSKEDLKHRLAGAHVNIHDLDFEVMEKDGSLRIIPHAEQIDAIKSLPITFVEFDEKGDKTNVKMTSRMRKLDVGAPMLVIILCVLMLLASAGLFIAHERFFGWVLLAGTVATFIAHRVNLKKNYFDCVKKVQDYVQSKAI